MIVMKWQQGQYFNTQQAKSSVHPSLARWIKPPNVKFILYFLTHVVGIEMCIHDELGHFV